MRYKVSFEFETNYGINGSPANWHWGGLLDNIEDDYTKIDFDSLTVFQQNWEELTDDD